MRCVVIVINQKLTRKGTKERRKNEWERCNPLKSIEKKNPINIIININF